MPGGRTVAPNAHPLSRRGFLRGCTAAAAALAGLPWGCGAPAWRRPNIVFIIADDLGYECLGCNGGTSYRTPHLDRLAASGLRFTNAFTTPLCTPSRVQVMSGQYAFRSGWTGGIWERPVEQQRVAPELIDLAQVLRGAGYATAVAGKWQLCLFRYDPDHPAESGFDEHCLWTWNHVAIGFMGRPPRYWRPGIWQAGQLDGRYRRDDVFAPDVFTDFLIDFIRRNRERRFFAYYPMVLPHLPFVPTPDNRREFERRGGGEWLFAGMVAYLDGLVGRIAAALDELGLREQTLIVFTGDNGTPEEVTSRLGDVEIPGGKGQMTSTGTHVPLIAEWRGTARPGAVCEDLIDSTDFLPTFAELAEAELPAGREIDGRSFAPQLVGERGRPREWVHIQLDDSRAVRDRRWMLFDDGRLYDLVEDPFERRPLNASLEGAEARAARENLKRVFASLT